HRRRAHRLRRPSRRRRRAQRAPLGEPEDQPPGQILPGAIQMDGALTVSIKAMSLVWDHSQQKGSGLILLLAVADYANENNQAWPSISTLAAKIRMSDRNTQILLRKIVDSGELEMQPNA